MRWGILFRREISLTYARIQDIHLRSNIVERWLGLARIEVQTASGSSGAEMTLEGLLGFEAIRDFLYSRMRGVGPTRGTAGDSAVRAGGGFGAAAGRELVEALTAVSAEIRALRRTLEARRRD
jgi:putative membrane protein